MCKYVMLCHSSAQFFIFVFDGIFYRRGTEVRERQYVAPLWLEKRTQLTGLNEGGFIKTFHIKENKDMNK